MHVILVELADTLGQMSVSCWVINIKDTVSVYAQGVHLY